MIRAKKSKLNAMILITAFLLVIAIVAASYYFIIYIKQSETVIETNNLIEDSETKSINIANVKFQIPSDWIEFDRKMPTGNDVYVEPRLQIGFIDIKPSDGVKTLNGGDYFVGIAVYSNESRLSAKDWLIEDAGSDWGGIGNAYGDDIEDSLLINNYDSYYRKSINSSYQDIHYSITDGIIITYIYSRIYESALGKIGDYTDNEVYINNIAESIEIE